MNQSHIDNPLFRSTQKRDIFQYSVLVSLVFILLLIVKFTNIYPIKIGGISIVISFIALINVFYSNKTMYKKWELFEDYFTVKEFLSFKPKKYNYISVSSYRLIMHQSGGYKEVHIWFKNKEKISAFSVDYKNFDELMECFIEKMNNFDIDCV